MFLHADHLLDGLDGIAYLMHPDGTIIAVGRRNWNTFAEFNGGSALVDGAGVVGRNLFSFVAGDDVRQSYRDMFGALRSGRRRAIRLSYRCDSPEAERHLRLSVSAVGSSAAVDAILIQSQVVTVSMRPAVPLFDFTARNGTHEAGDRRPILFLCSYCQSVCFPPGCREDEGEWIEAVDYYRRGGDGTVRISHGMCPGCADDAARLFNEDFDLTAPEEYARGTFAATH